MSKYKITGIIYIPIGMNEFFLHENFHTKHGVFTAPDAHLHTSLSYSRERERENSNSKTLIPKDSSVRSIWTYLKASPCYATNTNKHDNTTNKYYKHD